MKETVPDVKRLAVFWNPANPLHPRVVKDLEAPARSLAIEQPTTFHVVINMKTAKSLGLPIPPSVFLRAHQVIE